MPPTAPGADDRPDTAQLLAAVRGLREELNASRLPLALPSAAAAERARRQLLDQLDDYVLPRLESIEAPLLAVVGGSTGAGKSTLVNTIVGRQVSKPGVLRPTTRSPVLVHHEQDAHWFTGERILPGLARVTGADRAEGEGPEGGSAVRLVVADALPAGLALLDAPDIDSVVTANRDLAAKLLAAADLWVFVTTAARYADAVPWELLRQARDRGTAVAVVLDRVPEAATQEISEHLRQMLTEQSLGAAPVFTIPEVGLGADGLLPPEVVRPVRDWLSTLAGDAQARALVVRQTLAGALASLDARVTALAEASREQVSATAALTAQVDQAYATALEGVDHGMSDGSLLRGEVLARWQEFVGTGEFIKQVETTISRVRDRLGAAIRGKPAPERDLGEALHTGVAALVLAEARGASARIARTWRTMPGGPVLLEGDPGLATADPELAERVERLVRDWQGDVLDLVRGEGQDRRTTAKVMAYGVNGVGVMLMLVAFAHGGTLVGAEVGIAGGTAVVGQKLLEAIFGDQAVRSMAAKARAGLLERVRELYAGAADRYEAAVRTVEVRGDQPRRLEHAVTAIQVVR